MCDALTLSITTADCESDCESLNLTHCCDPVTGKYDSLTVVSGKRTGSQLNGPTV